MKIVVNRCFGGFSVSDEACEALGLDSIYGADRYDERLIHMVEDNAYETSGWAAKLAVVEIPDEATDHIIIDYDGCESVCYVVDGKIYRT